MHQKIAHLLKKIDLNFPEIERNRAKIPQNRAKSAYFCPKWAKISLKSWILTQNCLKIVNFANLQISWKNTHFCSNIAKNSQKWLFFAYFDPKTVFFRQKQVIFTKFDDVYTSWNCLKLLDLPQNWQKIAQNRRFWA